MLLLLVWYDVSSRYEVFFVAKGDKVKHRVQ